MTTVCCPSCGRGIARDAVYFYDECITQNNECLYCMTNINNNNNYPFLKSYLVSRLGDKMLGFKLDLSTGIHVDMCVHFYNNTKIGVGAARLGFHVFNSLDEIMGEKQAQYLCEKAFSNNFYDSAKEIALFFEQFFKSEEFYKFFKGFIITSVTECV